MWLSICNFPHHYIPTPRSQFTDHQGLWVLWQPGRVNLASRWQFPLHKCRLYPLRSFFLDLIILIRHDMDRFFFFPWIQVVWTERRQEKENWHIVNLLITLSLFGEGKSLLKWQRNTQKLGSSKVLHPNLEIDSNTVFWCRQVNLLMIQNWSSIIF